MQNKVRLAIMLVLEALVVVSLSMLDGPTFVNSLTVASLSGPSLSVSYSVRITTANTALFAADTTINGNKNKSRYHRKASTHQSRPPVSSDQQSRRQDSLDAGRDPLLSLNLNLDALARAQAAERAQELYCRIAALHAEGYYDVQPDIVSFNSVLKAWSNNHNPARALEFWEQEAARHNNKNNNDNDNSNSSSGSVGGVNVRSYNTFLLALARAGLVEPAQNLLRQMMYANAAVRPDRISWNTVLLACCVAQQAEAAEALLEEMLSGELNMKSFHDDEDDYANNNDSNNSSNNSQPQHDKHPLPPVVDLKYAPPRPDATSFNTVLAAWSARGNGARAEDWLRRMRSQGQVEPDAYSYTTVLQAWRQQGLVAGRQRRRQKRDDCMDGNAIVERALQLWNEFDSSSNNSLARPNRVTYTVLLQILCDHGHVTRAQEILQQRMLGQQKPDVRPDVIAFGALMNGWAKYAALQGNTAGASSISSKEEEVAKEANRRRAVETVLALLEQMKQLAVTLPELTPNEYIYTSVLSTLAEARLFDSGMLAKRILNEMSQSSTVQPSLIHYNAALDCCAKAPRATKALDALELWQEMKAATTATARPHAVRPDVISYNTILNAAATAFGEAQLRRESLRIGEQAYAELQSDPDCDPTSLTYAYYFKLLRRLLPAEATTERSSLIRDAFRWCCEQGCLNEMVWQQVTSLLLLKANDTESSSTLLGASTQQRFADLPPEWSRHALTDRRQRR